MQPQLRGALLKVFFPSLAACTDCLADPIADAIQGISQSTAAATATGTTVRSKFPKLSICPEGSRGTVKVLKAHRLSHSER